ncbi:MFS transporter [Plantactinospora soyae]|uniref:DHA1 family purine ribonucleoside efflux pump-like MFS transporter n=1 Tax=Plantactinospora soyae TaxID=1544732 RepID=A0A927MAG1_9ACTN|nr:MFS transporter [Plantactinospora soyae]MBE1491148.1 DHA1 family purine ribonucleoside efflux pump-like MFS transporter [Plantactinospora soyae]
MTRADPYLAPPPTRGSWAAVVGIALGAFALVVTEFLPVGLLPDMTREFGVSEGTAGLAITATALLGAIAAPLTTIVIGRLDRRTVLLSLTGLLVVAGAISAFAQHFAVLIAGRVLLGVAVGGFWAVSLAAAARLVPHDRVHTASSLVLGGISVGAVVSVPAASFISAHYDWRIAYGAATALAVVVFLIQLVLLPRIPMHRAVVAGHFRQLLAMPKVRAILLTVVLIVGGHYAGYTFVTPYLEQLTGLQTNSLSILLLVYGVVTVVGTFIGGVLAARHRHRAVLITTGVFLLSMTIVAAFAHDAVVTTPAVLAWALAIGMAPVCTQLWLYANTTRFVEAAQAMNTGVFQLSIALGSLLGAVTVDLISLHSSMWLGAAALALAALVVLVVGRVAPDNEDERQHDTEASSPAAAREPARSA